MEGGIRNLKLKKMEKGPRFFWGEKTPNPNFSPNTLPETNIATRNGWLKYYFPIGQAYFQGRTVSFREGMIRVGSSEN